MIQVRIFEEGKAISDSLIEECYMEVLPTIDDLIAVSGKETATYKVKSRVFYTENSTKNGQRVAIGVIAISSTPY